jgi:hypothetical protein
MMKKAMLLFLSVAIVVVFGAGGCRKKQKQEEKPKEEITLVSLAQTACDAKKSGGLVGEAFVEFNSRLVFVDDGSGTTEAEVVKQALAEYRENPDNSNFIIDINGCKALSGEVACKAAYGEIAAASGVEPDRVAEIGAAMKISECGIIEVSSSEDKKGEHEQKVYVGKINDKLQMFFTAGVFGMGGMVPEKTPPEETDKSKEPLSGADGLEQKYFNQDDAGTGNATSTEKTPSSGTEYLDEQYFNQNGAGGDGVPTGEEQPSDAGGADEQ